MVSVKLYQNVYDAKYTLINIDNKSDPTKTSTYINYTTVWKYYGISSKFAS